MKTDTPDIFTLHHFEDTVKALWHQDRKHSILKETALPQPGKDQMLLQSNFSLISLGTELTIARGLVPEALHSQMRVPHMEGEFIFPVKYGYSLVAQNPSTGVYYHLMCPHQDACLGDIDECFEIPDGIPPKRAILASNLGTALTGVWDGLVLPGERAAIVGFGMIGSLVARIVQGIPGTSVSIIDTNPARQGYAVQFGFTVLQDLHSAVKPFDIAFHCSATQGGLQTAIDVVGFEGRVIELSWYGNREVTLNLGSEFHYMRKRIVSSQVSNIPGSMQSRWDRRRRQECVFDLLKNPAYDQHITHEISLEEAAGLFNTWRGAPPEGLGYCICY